MTPRVPALQRVASSWLLLTAMTHYHTPVLLFVIVSVLLHLFHIRQKCTSLGEFYIHWLIGLLAIT